MSDVEGGTTTPRGEVDRVAVKREREADERETRADEREAALDARELRSQAREASSAAREGKSDRILAEAGRDDQADARDSVADERERGANLDSLLGHDDFDAALKARASAALDRLDPRQISRIIAADRSKLTED